MNYRKKCDLGPDFYLLLEPKVCPPLLRSKTA
jgi:hypothetical protein